MRGHSPVMNTMALRDKVRCKLVGNICKICLSSVTCVSVAEMHRIQLLFLIPRGIFLRAYILLFVTLCSNAGL